MVDGDGCWLWTANRAGGRCGRQYGQFTTWRNGTQRHIGAHEFAYELTHGPIPEGLEILHACNRGICVRPSHLSVGTHRQNVQDAARDGLYHVPRPKRQKVTDAECDEMVALRRAGMTLADIGARYGVTKAFVCQLAKGRRRQFREQSSLSRTA